MLLCTQLLPSVLLQNKSTFSVQFGWIIRSNEHISTWPDLTISKLYGANEGNTLKSESLQGDNTLSIVATRSYNCLVLLRIVLPVPWQRKYAVIHLAKQMATSVCNQAIVGFPKQADRVSELGARIDIKLKLLP